MSNDGSDDTPPGNPGDGFTSDRARRLFGHKGGAKAWEDPAPGPRPDLAKAETSSAPYPRDARYTPREDVLGEAVDDDAELTKLHPNYKLLMRFGALIGAFALMIGALSADAALANELGTPFGILSGLAFLLALFLVIRLPNARYNARGYQMSSDRLRVVRGVLWHSDTIVPFGRVQHIDVDQGPVERALGIATMTLHTAGSHNASVQLPGLGHELATEMREDIRAHIKRESL